MAFTDTQIRHLKAKLDPKYVKTRKANGVTLNYVEGWHVIAEANRIFGFDAWSRETVSITCVSSGSNGGVYEAAYLAKVRVSVRSGEGVIVREGSGTGEGKAPTPGQAHELALKGAETDATKRALATFGNPFGLALYDRELAGVRKIRKDAATPDEQLESPWVLRSATGDARASFERSADFVDALREAMSRADDIELLYDLWEQNLGSVRALNRKVRSAGVANKLVAHLRACAVGFVKEANGAEQQHKPTRSKIDKSVLTIGEPKRIRCKQHLKYVASKPCVICGRSPSQAHHVRFAQARGVALKVSDEFVVPLCAVHHRENHTTGDERRWWHERNLDPLAIAGELWRQSRTPNGLIATPAPMRDPEQLMPVQRVDSAKPQEV
jgi:DNA recombination protein Rad52